MPALAGERNMQAIRLVVLIFLLMVLPFCGKNPVEPDTNDHEERILFIRSAMRDGSNEICTMRPDGTDLKVLARYVYDGGYLHHGYGYATWSHDKSFIAVLGGERVSRDYDPIYLFDSDGRMIKQLTYDGSRPVWLPDNRHIIFARGIRLYILEIESLKERILLFEKPGHRLKPADWSGTSTLLISDNFRYVDSLGVMHTTNMEVALLDTQTKAITYLTSNRIHDIPTQFSAHGDSILYISGTYVGSNIDVYYYDISESLSINLTNKPALYTWALCSPSGDKIAYDIANEDLIGSDMYIHDLNTNVITQLTETAADSVTLILCEWK